MFRAAAFRFSIGTTTSIRAMIYADGATTRKSACPSTFRFLSTATPTRFAGLQFLHAYDMPRMPGALINLSTRGKASANKRRKKRGKQQQASDVFDYAEHVNYYKKYYSDPFFDSDMYFDNCITFDRLDGYFLQLKDDDNLRCTVCGCSAKSQKALDKHFKIHTRERNKVSGRGNGKKKNKKPKRRGDHALLPPLAKKEKKKKK